MYQDYHYTLLKTETGFKLEISRELDGDVVILFTISTRAVLWGVGSDIKANDLLLVKYLPDFYIFLTLTKSYFEESMDLDVYKSYAVIVRLLNSFGVSFEESSE